MNTKQLKKETINKIIAEKINNITNDQVLEVIDFIDAILEKNEKEFEDEVVDSFNDLENEKK